MQRFLETKTRKKMCCEVSCVDCNILCPPGCSIHRCSNNLYTFGDLSLFRKCPQLRNNVAPDKKLLFRQLSLLSGFGKRILLELHRDRRFFPYFPLGFTFKQRAVSVIQEILQVVILLSERLLEYFGKGRHRRLVMVPVSDQLPK